MNNKIRVFLGLLISLILISIAGSNLKAAEMTPLSGIPVIEDIKPLAVGNKVPYFVVNDIDGNEFDTDKRIGKTNYMFIFWSIFCEPCKEEMPLIKLLTDKYKKDELTVVAINLDGEPFKNAIKAYAQDGDFSFIFIIDQLDEEEFFKIADPYGVAGTPTMYIIDKKGIVQFSEMGKIKRSVLQEAIDSVVKK